jgi:pimeloyl-ACP methyl ester carboxylesterase
LLVIIFILWNGISAHKEKKFLKNIDYGKKIDVNGHNMSVDILGDSNNQTIVILPGLGAASPILQFKPIAEALSDTFRMITVEPFGYGFSDFEIEEERFTKEITSELYTCLEKLHLDNFYLMAHSISGIYSLKFANDYPSKVLGFIGLDATVPTKEELKPNYFSSNEKIVAMKPLLDTLGFSRLYSYINPTFNIEIDPSYMYTESEIEIFKFLNRNKSYNKLILNELQHFSDNVNEMHNVSFPETVPVLNFVASETLMDDPYWIGDHYREIREKHKSKVIPLKGSHYIHLDQKEAIVQKIKEWMD